MTTELIFGVHSVEALLRASPERVTELWLTREGVQRCGHIVALAEAAGIAVEVCERRLLDQWIDGNHQGLVARYKPAPTLGDRDLWPLLDTQSSPLLLVLDGVTDPHNLGACLRTADAAGVDVVIAPRDKAAGLGPVVRKVASGAAERLPFVAVTNLARTLDQLKERGIWVVGTAGEAGQSLYDLDLRGPIAVVLGAEGRGLRRLTRERCDFLASIPMSGSVTSLNVSVAAGVCLFEALRQRGASPG